MKTTNKKPEKITVKAVKELLMMDGPFITTRRPVGWITPGQLNAVAREIADRYNLIQELKSYTWERMGEMIAVNYTTERSAGRFRFDVEQLTEPGEQIILMALDPAKRVHDGPTHYRINVLTGVRFDFEITCDEIHKYQGKPEYEITPLLRAV